MKAAPRVKRLFSPFIIAYCLCVVLVVSFIIYIAFNKTTVTVTLKQRPQEYNFNYTAAQINGLELSSDVSEEYIFTEYAATEEAGTATGEVTIINNYSAAQPLVATTRLLSEDGVLFRTEETVTVPAGGQVTVPVYADQAGANGNIGPSKFEIVALWDGLKDNIYAQSSTPMTGGVIKRVTMTEAIAEQAKSTALAEAKATVITAMQEQAAETDATEAMAINPDQVIFEAIEQTVAPTTGATGDTVVVTTTGHAFTILYTFDNVLTQLRADTQQAVLDNTVTLAVNTDHQLVGSVALPQVQSSLDFIDPVSLTSKTPQQIKEQLMTYDQVADVTVNLSPIWATRSPALEQQIELQLNSQP